VQPNSPSRYQQRRAFGQSNKLLKKKYGNIKVLSGIACSIQNVVAVPLTMQQT
jgi:hypothetical protein